jgi:hypothetical protein
MDVRAIPCTTLNNAHAGFHGVQDLLQKKREANIRLSAEEHESTPLDLLILLLDLLRLAV